MIFEIQAIRFRAGDQRPEVIDRLTCDVPDLETAKTKAKDLSCNLLVGPRMAASFGVELDDGLVDGAIKVIRAGEGLMSEVMPLQVAPDPFDVVELRSVFRQPLDPEPVGALGEGRP